MRTSFRLILCTAALIIIGAVNVDALDTGDWVSGDVSVWSGPAFEPSSNDQSMLAIGKRRGCISEEIRVEIAPNQQINETGCVTYGKNFKYTVFRNTTPVISAAGDDKMYRINVPEMSELIPGTDTLMFVYGLGPSWTFNISKDISSHITKSIAGGFTSYSFEDPSMLKAGLSISPSLSAKVSTFGFSKNGRYVAWLGEDYQPSQYKIIDLQTNQVQAFDFDTYGQNLSHQDMTVSNDGKFVAWTSQRALKVWKLENCGYAIPMQSSTFGAEHKCLSYQYDLSTLFNVSPFADSYSISFSNDNSTLSLLYSFEDGIHPIKLQIDRTPESVSRLDYLALGDSYSSGEGDIGKMADGSSFYVPGTEDSKGCHISIRSYPFLLAQKANLADGRMQSIACSGARVAKDYYGPGDTYFGQGQKLKNKSKAELDAIRSDAARDFTPGVLKQIEFVKENKPKTITLTGGGNDIGFVDVLKSCIFAYGIGERARTCDEAVAGTKKRAILGDAIRGQFDTTVKLIEAIKEASDTTTIYVVGYPSFITNGASTCVNSATLNNAERTTINTSLDYLNDILEAAARSAGARYIDTTDSLNGGRICEGSRYVTGVMNVLSSASQLNNMFHPNSDGHAKLANTISANGFAITAGDNPTPVETAAPVKPNTFGSSAYVPTTQEKLLTSDAVVEVGGALGYTSPSGMLLTSGDKVSFTLYSNPTNLGTLTVPANGIVSSTTRLPKSIDPGMHMLVAEVTSKNITKQRFFEYVEVLSNNPLDRDADGIRDSKDPCLFVESWYDEGSTRNICKPASTGQGGNNEEDGHGASQPKPNPGPIEYWKYWKSRHIRHIFGFVMCIGIFSLRLR